MASSQQFLFAPDKPLVKRLGKRFFQRIPRRPGVYKTLNQFATRQNTRCHDLSQMTLI